MLGEKYCCVLSIGSELDSLQLWRSKEANTLEIRTGRNRIEKKIKLDDTDTTFHFYTIEVSPDFIMIAVDEKELERIEPNPIPLPLYGLQYNKPLGKNPKLSYGEGSVKAWGILVEE